MIITADSLKYSSIPVLITPWEVVSRFSCIKDFIDGHIASNYPLFNETAEIPSLGLKFELLCTLIEPGEGSDDPRLMLTAKFDNEADFIQHEIFIPNWPMGTQPESLDQTTVTFITQAIEAFDAAVRSHISSATVKHFGVIEMSGVQFSIAEEKDYFSLIVNHKTFTHTVKEVLDPNQRLKPWRADPCTDTWKLPNRSIATAMVAKAIFTTLAATRELAYMFFMREGNYFMQFKDGGHLSAHEFIALLLQYLETGHSPDQIEKDLWNDVNSLDKVRENSIMGLAKKNYDSGFEWSKTWTSEAEGGYGQLMKTNPKYLSPFERLLSWFGKSYLSPTRPGVYENEVLNGTYIVPGPKP